MLELAGGIADGVDVGDLLQLQRAFEGGDVLAAASQEDRGGGTGEDVGRFTDRMFAAAQGRCGLLGQGAAGGQGSALGGGVHQAFGLGDLAGEQIEGQDLSGVRLGRGHADFWARQQRHDPVGFTRDGRGHHVDQRDHRNEFSPRQTQPGQGVGGFAALADRDDQGAAARHRIAIAILGGDIDFDMDARQVFEVTLAEHRRVPASPAGEKDNVADGG